MNAEEQDLLKTYVVSMESENPDVIDTFVMRASIQTVRKTFPDKHLVEVRVVDDNMASFICSREIGRI